MGSINDSASFQSLLEERSYAEVAYRLIEIEVETNGLSRSALGSEPFGVLAKHPGFEVAFEPQDKVGCSVAGYYRDASSPPVLVVHPSGSNRRDAFTILHEYGHFAQMACHAWSDILLMLPNQKEATEIGERVADEFASEILLPRETLDLDPADVSARGIRDFFESQALASRSALAYRVISKASGATRVMIAVLADGGESVLFARSSADLMAPGRGLTQPALKKLVQNAQENKAGLAFESNSEAQIYARSGWNQSNLRLEVAVDTEGYAFVVARPRQRFDKTQWSRDHIECANLACEASFEVDDNTVKCKRCGGWKCPECGRCDCSLTADHVCPNCHFALSPAEIAGSFEHECWGS